MFQEYSFSLLGKHGLMLCRLNLMLLLPIVGIVLWTNPLKSAISHPKPSKQIIELTTVPINRENDLPRSKRKLAIIPGQKPPHQVTLDIEKYLRRIQKRLVWRSDVIPNVLTDEDVSRYRVIFHLQRDGEWHLADQIIYTLRDPILMGHVLAQRYLHPTKYRTKYREFKTWLGKYNKHPEARRIYKLALKRRPRNWRKPNKPIIKSDVFLHSNNPRGSLTEYHRQKNLPRAERREMLRLERRLRIYLRKGWTLAFKKLIQDQRTIHLFHPWQIDRAQARLAAGYFAAGRDRWALDWAEKAIKRSGKTLPVANWTAGLAAWRLGKFSRSLEGFDAVSRSSYASSWLISAGAFWASRASIKIRRYQEFTDYLKVAAKYPRTFYGLLACRILGKEVEYNWGSPQLTKEAVIELTVEPGGKRAIALMQIGEESLAERVLRIVFSKAKPNLAKAMLAIADRANMPALAMRLGSILDASGPEKHDSTTYPAPHLPSEKKENIDRELILAIVRQESGFNPKARSYRGARGLMQLMPGTASFVARDRRFRRSKLRKLFEPKTNLALGQRYLNILLADKNIKGNLFRMMAAWNAGPGNLNKWSRALNFNNDPLLFIETIPSRETRIFIERVMTNFWIYRARFDQLTNTLDAVVAGKWPVYHRERLDRMEKATEKVEIKN